MSQVSEVKCPHCKEWTLWRGHIDDRCLYCNHFLDPQRFSREVERKIRREVVAESDLFFLKPEDGPTKRRLKIYFNSFRWWVYYVQIAFVAFITLLMFLIGLCAG